MKKEDIKLLIERKFHIVGALHILRSEEDLQLVMLNAMQSIKIIILYIAKCRLKYGQNKKYNIEFLDALELAISKFLKKLAEVSSGLKDVKGKICIPGTSMVTESIATMLTKVAIYINQLEGSYSSDYTVPIIGLVNFALF